MSTPGAPAAGANAAMIEYWNVRAGPGWVAGQPAIDAHLAPFVALAMKRARPRPGERVLDVGCGCGATTLALAEAVGSDGRVVGLDISAPMLARAEERARDAGLTNVSFVNADAQSAALETGFDLVFSRFGVMFFADFAVAFRNLRSALAPGGRLCFLSWRELARNPWMTVPIGAARTEIEVPPPAAPGEPGPYGLADGDALRDWLAQAGFAGIRLESIDVGLPVRGGAALDEAADFMASMGPVAAALREVGDEQREPVRAAIREAMRAHQSEAGVVLGASVWWVDARNPG